MSSGGRKRKADVAPADHKGGGSGSAQRSLQPRLTSTAGGASSTTSPSGSAASSSASRAPLKPNQQQRQQAAEQRRLRRQHKMAADQRDKRARHRARIKQLKEKAEAAEAVAAATAGPKDPAHWESVDTKHGNKHLLQLTKEKRSAELGEVEQHWQNTQGQGTIVSVHRIQNSALHHRFEGMRQTTPGLTEQVAYHGTRTNVPALIYDSLTGFDMRRGMAQPGYLWFAQQAGYSSSGYWHGVSQATLPFGQPAMVYDPLTYTWTAPFKQLMRVRLLLNSAEVAQPYSAGVFLVNQSERCLPEYLITFK